MASSAAAIGTGATVAFAASSFSGNLLGLSHSGMSRPILSTAHMGTAAVQSGELNNVTKLPGKHVDGGSFVMNLHLNPDTVVPTDDDPETVTITFEEGATWVFQGCITDVSGEIPMEEIMTRDVTVEVCGPIAVTAAA